MNNNIFNSRNEVKWCPGCGNYAILASMHKVLNSLNLSNENVVFVSGIGCSGRFPYYVNTHGFHTIHGRAPSVALGLKVSRPDLLVWLVIGDGDGFSIGLGSVLHLLRKNIDINILFINNKVYGLTKGQYSPTSEINSITKSSPYGSLEDPINPILLALDAGATFVARSIDTDKENLEFLINLAINHKGISFIEVLQNCIVYNDKAFLSLNDKFSKFDKLINLRNNKKLIFGNDNDKGLFLSSNFKLEITYDIHNNYSKVITYDSSSENIIQNLLARFSINDNPYPIGVFRSIEKETYQSKLDSVFCKSKSISSIDKFIIDYN